MEMNELDFTLELNSETLSQESEYALYTKAEDQLKQLAAGHTDMRGAAINVRQPAHAETPPWYEVTAVVYGRPDNIAATKKDSDPFLALKGALDAVERQIRQRREKLKKQWQQPGNQPIEQEMTELLAAESMDDPADDEQGRS